MHPREPADPPHEMAADARNVGAVEEEPRSRARRGTGPRSLDPFASAALDWPAVREVLVEFTQSSIGRRALRSLEPRSDAEACLALARSKEMQAELEAGGLPPLAGIPDPLDELSAAATYGRTLGGETLADVASFLRVIDDLDAWFAARRQRLPTCCGLWGGMPDFSGLRERIDREVDRRGHVPDDATPALKALRLEIARLERELDQAVRKLAHRPELRGCFSEGQAGQVHRRGHRRVLAVRQRHAGRLPGMVHDRSQSGETIFVEPRELVETGNRLAELESDAEREVSRILLELTREVLRRIEDIQLAHGRVGELELAVIGGRYGREVGGHCARTPGTPGAAAGLLLRGWRHPLLLGTSSGSDEEVVPIDIRLGEEFDLLVVTGPNTGGKTLALKGAGLAALMTRMGFPIPCSAGSTVPLYRSIFADIGDEQEIQQNLSTFSSHLVRIQAGLERAGPDSLCLLDELGGGTDPTEGAALGEAILERLLTLGAPTIATTHLGKLKEIAFRHERAENAHVEFDVETLAPRYRLVIGAPGRSRALAIARRLGFAEALVARAEACLEPTGDDAEGLMDEMRGVRMEAERLRREAEERTFELERLLASAAELRSSLETRGEHLEAEAQRGIEERLARVREWLMKGEALLPRLKAESRSEVAKLLAGIEQAIQGASLSDRRSEFLTGLRKGSIVWLPRFKKRCPVLRIWKEKRELTVRLGQREMSVGFDDVSFYESV